MNYPDPADRDRNTARLWEEIRDHEFLREVVLDAIDVVERGIAANPSVATGRDYAIRSGVRGGLESLLLTIIRLKWADPERQAAIDGWPETADLDALTVRLLKRWTPDFVPSQSTREDARRRFIESLKGSNE